MNNQILNDVMVEVVNRDEIIVSEEDWHKIQRGLDSSCYKLLDIISIHRNGAVTCKYHLRMIPAIPAIKLDRDNLLDLAATIL